MIDNTRDPDILLKLVEELTMDEVTPDLLVKMEKVERALANFLKEAEANQQPSVAAPRPPSIPPPMGAFFDNDDYDQQPQKASSRPSRNNNNDNNKKDNPNLVRAQDGLQKLRQRLRQRESTLRQAQEALQRSRDEENILSKAEQALQKSREAAEKRKQEAIRQTKDAVESAEQARREQEEQQAQLFLHQKQELQDQEQRGRNQKELQQNNNSKPRRRTVSLDDIFNDDRLRSNQRKKSKPRPTMMLESLSDVEKRKSGRRSSGQGKNQQVSIPSVPVGTPVLYEWIQNADGSISGFIRGSSNFQDGATISTSSVELGAREGTTVTTVSGSQYFLERRQATTAGVATEISIDECGRSSDNNPPQHQKVAAALAGRLFQSRSPSDSLSSDAKNRKLPTQEKNAMNSNNSARSPPKGVPSIRNWSINDHGGISGSVFGSTNAADGDYIETSCLANLSIAQGGNVVETRSGSRYFLCSKPLEEAVETTTKGFSLGSFRRSGTITIAKARETKPPRSNVDTAMDRLEKSMPRTTFSLFDLLGAKPKKPIPPPPTESAPAWQTAPQGVPTLTGWTYNDDGTISGIIFGSSSIGDGNLVNTSPVAGGVTKRFETVVTVTGSIYFLG